MADPVAKNILLLERDMTLGGDASVTSSLAERLREKGREVMIFCSGGNGYAALLDKGVKVIKYSRAMPAWLVGRGRKSNSALTDFEPDLIHAQSRILSRIAKNLSARLNCPYVLTINDRIGKARALPLDRERIKLIIAVNDIVRQELISVASIPEDMIRLIPKGVHPERFADTLPFGNGAGPGNKTKGQNGSAQLVNGHVPVI
ncbi:MAG: glycosyltransferase family 4 protein, partial [Planctomycetota bacterium]|nr:glycosyltransferase family 4 protein [Planctomycetota bacterium]